jgi:two-component system, chemotaxis family, CheB/CheR fusion protein
VVTAWRKPLLVVGLGASAGGLEALEAFMRAVEPDSGMAFIVVQHLSPDHKSHMVELLAKHTKMKVVAAEEGARIERDTVYLIPPRKVLSVDNEVLHLEERGAGLTLPVDILFRSLAESFGEIAAGIILSGTGSDGMRGVRALKESGGLVMVQDPTTAKFDGMPRSAISAGSVDYVLPVHEMPPKLMLHVQHQSAPVSPDASADDDAFDRLTGLLRRQTGVDFSNYRPTTLHRRIQRRMAINQKQTIEEYAASAQTSRDEVNLLFKELLISVTRFFRDAAAFECIQRDVIPAMIEKIKPGEPLRIWVAGCATGEEAYSLAMLLEEYFEHGGRPREAKIFATDIDKEALEYASAAVYPESIAADVSPDRLQRFFVRHGDAYHVARFIRQRVVFANHDLTRDPPFSRVSLISCRNLLIYFNQTLQRQVMAGFRFALRPGGFLFLGSSETPGELGAELQAAFPGTKIYRRTESPSRPVDVRDNAPLAPRPRASSPTVNPTVAAAQELLIAAHAPPSVVINEQHDVLHVFGFNPLIRVPAGAATLNLLQLLPSTVASVVSLATHRAAREDKEARFSGVPSEQGPVAIIVRPLPRQDAGRAFVATFEFGAQTSSQSASTSDSIVPDETGRQIRELRQELRESRENLQVTIEELETSNEELQATNEELVSSNEELQSTNEELQSMNEELHTLNAEYQSKIQELVHLNDDINNLLVNTRLGSVFLDADLNITRFTPAITQVMSLLDRDVGRPISHLALKFPAGLFFESLDAVRRTHIELEREFSLSDGQDFVLRVAPYQSDRSSSASKGSLVVTVLDVSHVKASERRLASIFDALPHSVALLDPKGIIRLVNRRWVEFSRDNGGKDDTCGVGSNYLGVCEGSAGVDRKLKELLEGRSSYFELEYPCHSPSEERWFLMQATRVLGSEGGVVVAHVDITGRKRAELEILRRSGGQA